MCLWQLIAAHETSVYNPSLVVFQIVIYLDDSSSWLNDAINEFQAGCVGFPQGPLWLLWHLHPTSFYCTFESLEKLTFLINSNDICKKGIILHVNMFLIVSFDCVWLFNTFMFKLHHSEWTQCSRSESKQDGAELTTSDPSSPTCH